jgi:heat shock protein HslJ
MKHLLLLSLLLASCSVPATTSDPLAGTSWHLVEVHQPDGTVITANNETLSFRDGTASFQLGCNGCSVAYTVEGDVLRTGGEPPICTEMACPPDDTTPSTLLLGAMRFVQDGDQLRIESADTAAQQPTFVFRRADG